MVQRRAWCVALLTVACGSETSPEASERVAQVAARLTGVGVESAPSASLHFEDPTQWRGPDTPQQSNLHSEGDYALAVQPRGYSLYTSAPFSYQATLRSVALDLWLPGTQPNPYWYGALQLYASCPEKQLFSAYLGQVELTSLPLETFNELVVEVPASVRAALGGGCAGLVLSLAFNVPGSPGTYLLDNLRLRSELLLSYALDDQGARATDGSGYGHHGTLQGGARLVDDATRGRVLELDGTAAFVDLPSGILDRATELTVATWVKLERLGTWSRIFDFGGPGGFLYLTPSTHDGLLRYAAYTAFEREGIATAPALSVGVWKHVAVTAKGREYRVYVDGVEAGAALGEPVSPSQIGSGGGQWLGRSRFPDPFLAGRLDEFRLYDRALTQPEVAALATQQADYAHYGFDETGARVLDDSRLALHGTIVGAAGREPGIVGGALSLTSGHVQLPAGVVRDCSDFTFSAWTKLRSNLPFNRVFDFGHPDRLRFMYLSPAGFGPSGQELRFGLITPRGIDDLGYPFVAPLAEWTHLGVVLSAGTATLFLNGRPAATRSGIVSRPSDMGDTPQNTFGKSLFADPTFDGALDEARFSCRAFDARELRQLSHPPLPESPPVQRPLTGALTHVHDPAVIETPDGYHLFSTGPGVLTRHSRDLSDFSFTGSVFAETPAWVVERFGALDSLWAPDVSHFGGAYHLYYSASTFGRNRSCIGHATKLDLDDQDEPWLDRGPVICSNVDSVGDDFNAIDPNVVVDTAGAAWLSFGSFWGGLKLIPLTATGERAGSALHDIARGPGTAVEAPYIVYRAPYYYLFASFDACCRGVDSTYRVVVGRSTSVVGPYVDRTGLPMLQAGGTPVVSGSSRFRGPGHNAVLSTLGRTFNVYHAYDAANAGIPTLRVSELLWRDGWPISAEP